MASNDPVVAPAPETKDGHGISKTFIIWTPVSKLKKCPPAPDQEDRGSYAELHLWRNGFSVDDKPLLSYDQPQNVEYLEKIFSGEAPLLLFGAMEGDNVDVRIRPRRGEDFIEPKDRPREIPGLSTEMDKIYASFFGMKEVSDNIVLVRPVVANNIQTHRGLLVQYKSVIEAARAVDNMRVINPMTIYEFVKDICARGAQIFKGPFKGPIGDPSKGDAPPKPAHLEDVKHDKDAAKAIRDYKNSPIYWDMYAEAVDQQKEAKKMSEENPNERCKPYFPGDWVCSACNSYNFNKRTTCFMEECAKPRFSPLFENLNHDPDQEVIKPLDRQRNVMFLEAPSRVTASQDIHETNLPLLSMFNAEH